METGLALGIWHFRRRLTGGVYLIYRPGDLEGIACPEHAVVAEPLEVEVSRVSETRGDLLRSVYCYFAA